MGAEAYEAYMEPKPYGTLRLVFVLIGYTLLVNFGLSIIAGTIYASDWFQVIAAGEPTDFTTPKVRFQSMILIVNSFNWFVALPGIVLTSFVYWYFSRHVTEHNRDIIWIAAGIPASAVIIFRGYYAFFLSDNPAFQYPTTFILYATLPNVIVAFFIIWFSARKFGQTQKNKEHSE